jgi:hypothetical protein
MIPMLELIIILGLAACIGWQRFTYRRQVDRLLDHAVALQAELQALKLKGV